MGLSDRKFEASQGSGSNLSVGYGTMDHTSSPYPMTPSTPTPAGYQSQTLPLRPRSGNPNQPSVLSPSMGSSFGDTINQHASQGKGQRTGTPTLRPEVQAYWQLQHHHPAQHSNQPAHQSTQPIYQSTQPTHPQSAPGVGRNAELLDLFQAVDTDRSGHIEEKELNLALRNADWSYFDARTVAMMIRLFDADRSGHISFTEFQHLWGYLDQWKQLFDRFDSDRSGTIDFNEYRTALEAFGYRLSPEFIGQVFHKFAGRMRGAMSFDLFVQSCVILKLITKSFNRRDTDGDGYITVNFQDLVGIMVELQ